MRVSGIHHQGIHASVHQRSGALPGILAGADTRCHQQTAGGILGGVGVLLALGEVLDGDQSGELASGIHDGQLLHLVLAEQAQCLFSGDTLLGNHQWHGGHRLRNRAIKVLLEAHVTVGDDAHQLAIRIHHGQAGNAVTSTEVIHLADSHLWGGGNWVLDHASLGALHDLHLLRLILNGQVAVQHTHATLASHGHSHTRFGHGIHGCGGNGHVDADVARQLSGSVHIGRNHIGCVRKQEDVIKSQPYQRNFLWVVAACGYGLGECHARFLPQMLCS